MDISNAFGLCRLPHGAGKVFFLLLHVSGFCLFVFFLHLPQKHYVLTVGKAGTVAGIPVLLLGLKPGDSLLEEGRNQLP